MCRSTLKRSVQVTVALFGFMHGSVHGGFPPPQIMYELLETGSTLSGGAMPDAFLGGHFVLSLEQKGNEIVGVLYNIDFEATAGGDAKVTGKGVYIVTSLGVDIADPPYPSSMRLHLRINDLEDMVLASPSPLNVSKVVFPRIKEAVLESDVGTDCFVLSLDAIPIREDLIRFFRRGDVSGDGEWNITDAVYLVLYLIDSTRVSGCTDASDVNDDGSVDIMDVMYLLQFLFNGSEIPPLPSVFCGVDETDDELDCNGQIACMAG